MSGADTAKLMTYRGFKVSAKLVLEHKSHAVVPEAPPDLSSKGLGQLVMDETRKAIINKTITITDDKLWKNVGPGLKAEAEMNKVRLRGDDRGTVLKLWQILMKKSTGYLAPVELRQLPAGDDPEGEIIDGEAVGLDD